MSRLSQPVSRLLAVLLLLVLITVVVMLVVLPVWSMNQQYTDELSAIKNRIEISERTVAIGDSLNKRLKRFSRWESGNIHYLASRSEALATAELQRMAKAVIVKKGGEVLSSQILPAREEGGFNRVAIRISMKGSLETLSSVFYDLEAGKTYLLLDNVRINARPEASRRRVTVGKTTIKRALDIKFELSGYYRGGRS
ncbi:MAG: type II secretion system protein GspM [Candidatus Sedimenticola sp. PURPLELP]